MMKQRNFSNSGYKALHVLIPLELYQQIEDIAQEREVSKAFLVQEILETYTAKINNEKDKN